MKFATAFWLLGTLSLLGCIEEVIDEKERSSARATVTLLLKNPQSYPVTYTVIRGRAVPTLVTGWCRDDKFQIVNTYAGKGSYSFMVNCDSHAPFKIRVDLKSQVPLIYVAPAE
jgi:hypothetical protein